MYAACEVQMSGWQCGVRVGSKRRGGEAEEEKGTQAQRNAISLEKIPSVSVEICFSRYSEINKNGNDLIFLFSPNSIPKCTGETGMKDVWAERALRRKQTSHFCSLLYHVSAEFSV